MVTKISDDLWKDARKNKPFRIDGKEYCIHEIEEDYIKKILTVSFIHIPDEGKNKAKEGIWRKMKEKKTRNDKT